MIERIPSVKADVCCFLAFDLGSIDLVDFWVSSLGDLLNSLLPTDDSLVLLNNFFLLFSSEEPSLELLFLCLCLLLCLCLCLCFPSLGCDTASLLLLLVGVSLCAKAIFDLEFIGLKEVFKGLVTNECFLLWE